MYTSVFKYLYINLKKYLSYLQKCQIIFMLSIFIIYILWNACVNINVKCVWTITEFTH